MAIFTRREWLATLAAGFAAQSAWSAETVRTATGSLPTLSADVLARRRMYLEKLQFWLGPSRSDYRGRLSHCDVSWEDWQKRTGELPPDFLSMRSQGPLPNPLLRWKGGKEVPIRTPQEWAEQRKWIRKQAEDWIYGQMPPAPDNLRSKVVDEHVEGDATIRNVLLEFGPNHVGKLKLQLQIPNGAGGPRPAFVTNHMRWRPWVNTAVRRGYIGCICWALDLYYSQDDDSDAWLDIYPEYDFPAVSRWAWGMMRAVDYLVTLPEVDAKAIAVGGHSRNSKSALLAAAFDERIGAVVPSRGNNGDQIPWRYSTDMYQSESLQEFTTGMPHWFHPRMRFFVGRENKLPIDQNALLSLIAPRGLLYSHAFNEHQGNALGVERCYRSVLEVYRFLGQEQNIGLYQQPGEHSSSVEDVERYFDFFDSVFGRGTSPKPEIWVHGYDYERWLRTTGERLDPKQFKPRSAADLLVDDAGRKIGGDQDWDQKRQSILKRIHWALGDAPPGIPFEPRSSRRDGSRSGFTSEGWEGNLYLRPLPGMAARSLSYGDDLRGYFYYPRTPEFEEFTRPADEGSAAADPANSSRRRRPSWPEGVTVPAVIWLHPYSYATGFSRYNLFGPYLTRGFATACFDQIGFGARSGHSHRFYDRYPKWSLIGKMVVDTLAILDELALRPGVDPSRIYLSGHALGAKVALIVAALDERVAGVTISCGFTPLRKDRPEKGTEGIWHYSHLHGLMPRLGAFIGHEERLPIDYDEILAAIAPRPLQVISPSNDWYADLDDVKETIESVRAVYRLFDRESELSFETPDDFNRISVGLHRQASWLGDLAGLPDATRRDKSPEEPVGK